MLRQSGLNLQSGTQSREGDKLQRDKSIVTLSVVTILVVALILVFVLAPSLLADINKETKLAPPSDNDENATECVHVQTVKAHNRTWTVKTTGTADFHTIQEAINAANPGDTISVSNGTYHENVVVNKTVSIIGEDKWATIIDGNNITDTVDMESNNVLISGFTITDGELSDIFISGSGATVKDNLICNASVWGVYLEGGHYNRIERNIIQFEGTMYLGNGIYLESSNDNVIVNNAIKGNYEGVLCANPGQLPEGPPPSPPSQNNTIYHNNFVQNTVQADSNANGINNWDDGISGNYWSDYNGTDLNCDGIGDAPYIVNGNNTDRYPLMGMFESIDISSGVQVSVVSNSTVEDFNYFGFNNTIVMHVSNMTADQTSGFCRLTIPSLVIPSPYNVTINNHPVNYTTVFENESLSIVYFGYQHSTLEITVTLEFPSPIILSLLMIATLFAVMTYKKNAYDKERREKVLG